MPKQKTKAKLQIIALSAVAVIVAVLAIIAFIKLANGKNEKAVDSGKASPAILEYSEEEKETKIIEPNGNETTLKDVPTVEFIDSAQKIEDLPDSAQGAYHDTSSWVTYRDAVIGQCTDIDGAYGSQCFDLASDFWKNYTGRWLSSCGTGAAKGTTECWEYNAGGEFDMVWDATKIQPGDWLVFDSGQFGHIGMALGYYNNGYVALLGQNQGGEACHNGGSSANIININLASFKGAFRPKTYIIPKPEPKPIEEKTVGCPIGTKIEVINGDTLGAIMIRCEGVAQWGEAMNAYATAWRSNLVKPGQIVYDGWNNWPGVGLYAGDTIERVK